MSRIHDENEEDGRDSTNPYQAPAPTSSDESNRNKTSAPEKSSGNAALFFFTLGICGVLYSAIWIRVYGFNDFQLPLARVGLAIGIATLAFSLIFVWFGIAIVREKRSRKT